MSTLVSTSWDHDCEISFKIKIKILKAQGNPTKGTGCYPRVPNMWALFFSLWPIPPLLSCESGATTCFFHKVKSPRRPPASPFVQEHPRWNCWCNGAFISSYEMPMNVRCLDFTVWIHRLKINNHQPPSSLGVFLTVFFCLVFFQLFFRECLTEPPISFHFIPLFPSCFIFSTHYWDGISLFLFRRCEQSRKMA